MKNIFIIICAVVFFCASPKGADGGTLEKGIAAFKSKEYNVSLEIIRPLAIKGGARAQFYLGKMYNNGKGITKDKKEAVKWYRKAADQGYANAQYNLAIMYYGGEGVTKDLMEAVKWFRKVADQGDADAQYYLAIMYYGGKGVTKDLMEAVKWFRKAVDQGHADAQYALALMYYRGEGVTKDLMEAVKWYRKAADQGHANAQYALADLYYRGEGVTKDLMEAVKWFRKAADQGDADAQCDLGEMYELGIGMAKDRREALIWILKTDDPITGGCYNSIGWNYHQGIEVPRDYAKAKEWYLKGAQKNEPYSQDNLGNIYKNGLGVDVDFNEAIHWYTLSADQGNKWGLLHLADMHISGLGTKRNYTKARDLYTRAANKGMIQAHMKLSEIYEFGLGVLKDLKLSAEWAKKAALVSKDYDSNVDVGDASMGVKRHRAQARSRGQAIEDLRTKIRFEVREREMSPYLNIKFGTYHALIIGNNDYRYLSKLNTAINDATAVNDLLKEKYGFQTKLLKNATRKGIIKALNGYSKRLSKADNLLVYYAGHGAFDEATKTGYWQPVDAEVADDTEWIANDRITRILSRLRANNVIVVADSCYSGTVFRGLGVSKLTNEPETDVFRRLIEKKTRVALTSGGNEPVPDAVNGSLHSVFANSFIKILRDNVKALTASRLANRLKEKVIAITGSYNIKQTPEFSNMHKAGHDGGDFLFVPKSLVFQGN